MSGLWKVTLDNFEPTTFIYVAIGFIVLTTLSTFVTMLIALFRGGWWLSSKLKEHDIILARHGKDIDAAHERNRWLEKKVIGGKT